jgi:hypothetical protein
MAERARRHGNEAAALRYHERARELEQRAQRVRNLVMAGWGAAEETPAQEPAATPEQG